MKRSRRPRLTFFALAGLVGLAVGPARAAQTYGDIAILPLSPRVDYFQHGYMEHRIRVTNRSMAHSRTITLEAPAQPFNHGGNGIVAIRRTIVVGPSSTATVSLPQHPLPIFARDISLAVSIDGRRQRRTVAVPSLQSSLGRHHRANISCVMVSRAVNADDLEKGIERVARPSSSASHRPPASSHRGRTVVLAKAESGTSEWSDNWLGYSCYDGVVLTSRDLARMPAAVADALRQYVKCGGSLFVLGGAAPPEGAWPMTRNVPGSITASHMLFGVYAATKTEDARDLNNGELMFCRRLWQETREPWVQRDSLRAANRGFPVIENMRIPVRGMLFIMVGFAVLIGPVNMIVLARKNRRVWMLWTVPALSTVTCAIVFLYAMLSEGVTPTVRIDGLTVLDERTHRATTVGLAAYYCPLTPAEGLHFHYDTEITPRLDLSTMHRGGTGRRVSWTKDQHLAAGWVSARVPAHFVVRKSAMRRERLPVARDEQGQLSVVNGLGVPIVSLWLADADGKIHRAENIAVGRRMELAPDGRRAVGRPDVLRGFYGARKEAKLFDLSPGKVAAMLRPNSYVAVLDGSPFIEQGLAGRVKSRTRNVVFGILGRNAR